MYTFILFLFILIIGYLLSFLGVSSYLPFITVSLLLALMIRAVYLLHQLHKQFVYENKSISSRLLEKRLNDRHDS
ncbi:hypothetical protein [Gracilibacillus salinarum]|uniref:DUF4083 domain-containing protein n=1 Tax=Gracilibacillus salinarum TaxID=2932255 RepID=A0ABY4GPZ3_9BACI|nr:hypothetical protein [Gracilibacillus salinarum]UOQ86309.1 hypothetical protein MUN87_05315 [Gracilibacillus salinarum]